LYATATTSRGTTVSPWHHFSIHRPQEALQFLF
jgi:hypothetical protein